MRGFLLLSPPRDLRDHIVRNVYKSGRFGLNLRRVVRGRVGSGRGGGSLCPRLCPRLYTEQRSLMRVEAADTFRAGASAECGEEPRCCVTARRPETFRDHPEAGEVRLQRAELSGGSTGSSSQAPAGAEPRRRDCEDPARTRGDTNVTTTVLAWGSWCGGAGRVGRTVRWAKTAPHRHSA